MALRAPERTPAEPDAVHEILGHWKWGRWHRVVNNGNIVAESSNPGDDVMLDAVNRGGTLQRERVFVPAESAWIDL